MERGEAEQMLRDCLGRVLVEHLDLFLSHAHERSITSQLFRCLADDERVPAGVSVDHEYNRVGDHYVKNLRKYVDGIVALDEDGEPVEAQAIPDILIHGRGDHTTNLVAIEVKIGADNDECDKSKIWALLDDPFAYEHGVLLSFRIEAQDGGSQVVPYWAWNPLPREQIDYEPVFERGIVSELAERGRLRIAGRREAREIT